MIFAIVLSLGVLYLWNVVINPPPPPPPPGEQAPQQAPENVPPSSAPNNGGEPRFDEGESAGEAPAMLPELGQTPPAAPVAPEAGATPAPAAKDAAPTPPPGEAAAAAPTPEPEPVIAPAPEEKFHTIETEQFTAVFSSFGGKLKSFLLKSPKYTRHVPGRKDREQVNVVTADDPPNRPYTLLLDQANFKFDPDQPFEIEQADGKSVTFKTTTPQGVIVKKRFAWRENYLFDFEVTVDNRAQAAATFFPKVRLVGRQSSSEAQQSFFAGPPVNLQIPKALIDGELWEETDKEELASTLIQKGLMPWTAIDDRYFLLALLPPDDERSQIAVKSAMQSLAGLDSEAAVDWLAITHSLEKKSVLPGDTLTLKYRAYVGPKEWATLTAVGSQMRESVDFWVLGFLARPMLWVLKYSYQLIPNWGIAIIILTIIIKALLYPLTKQSFTSMQKMKDLKPKMDQLKEKYGEDKQELNRQLMEMYKREKVNPMGGCLPMLLQMPVYIALYKMLQSSVELYNAPFIPVWLDDLALPDPYYVLPTLLAVLMYVQQKLTPTPDSQQQKMMLYMMPAMMFFFMLMLPSGLVLYILASTIMGIGQQWWINKRAEQKKMAALAAQAKP